MEKQAEVQKIDEEIIALKEEMQNTKGRKCEIFTRICGYHRTTTKWNTGKLAELKERKVYATN